MMDTIRTRVEDWNPPLSLNEFEIAIQPLTKTEPQKDDEEEEKNENPKKKVKFEQPPEPSPKGLYVYGTVGCGKSMIMDLFFSRVRESEESSGKLRLHFETFMSEVHRTLHQWSLNSSSEDLENHRHEMLRAMARSIVERANVVCFDEVQIPDPPAAVIVPQLFSYMFDYGAVIVCTSNRAPEDLSSGLGAHRAKLFDTFLEKLRDRCDIVKMDVQEDFRVLNAAKQEKSSSYLIVDQSSTLEMSPLNAIWDTLKGKSSSSSSSNVSISTLHVFGREIPVSPTLSECGGTARFHFNDLCGDVKPLGPSDYLVIAHRFHTILVDDIPRLTNRNHARRLIWLVDALYVFFFFTRNFIATNSHNVILCVSKKIREKCKLDLYCSM